MTLQEYRQYLDELMNQNGFLVERDFSAGIDNNSLPKIFDFLKPFVKMSVFSEQEISLNKSLESLGVNHSFPKPIICKFIENRFNFNTKKKLRQLYEREIYASKFLYNKVLHEDEIFYLACDSSNRLYILIEFNPNLTIIKFNTYNYNELEKGFKALSIYYQSLGADPTFIINIFNKNIQLYPPI